MYTPLIGITNFTSFEQVEEMSQVVKTHRLKGSQRQLHVGAMMSYKTLNGIPNRWQKVFPLKEKIAEIFSSDEVYNCLHYADYDDNFGLWQNLSRAISYGGLGIHAVQLDMIWPSPDGIKNGLHVSRKQLEVILQVGRKAFKQVRDDPQELVERLQDYDGIIHRVLLDKSGGEGIDMNAAELLPFMRAIKRRFSELGLVVAGGLGPETIHLVEPVLEEFPDVSIDAQGKLTNWDIGRNYLIKALELLR